MHKPIPQHLSCSVNSCQRGTPDELLTLDSRKFTASQSRRRGAPSDPPPYEEWAFLARAHAMAPIAHRPGLFSDCQSVAVTGRGPRSGEASVEASPTLSPGRRCHPQTIFAFCRHPLGRPRSSYVHPVPPSGVTKENQLNNCECEENQPNPAQLRRCNLACGNQRAE